MKSNSTTFWTCQQYFFLDQSLQQQIYGLDFQYLLPDRDTESPLNTMCHEFWSFTSTKAVTCNNNEDQCEFGVHNCGLDSVSGDKKQFLARLWLECRVLYSAPSLRLNSDFLVGISFNGKAVNLLHSNIFICKILFAHFLNSCSYSSGDN